MATPATGPLRFEPAAKVSLPEVVARETRRRRRRRVAWLAAALLAPLAAAVAVVALRPRPPPLEERFRQQPVSRGELVREVQATGRLDAVSSVAVGAEISGRIATVEVDFNDPVEAGQVLARFDRASLEAQRAQSNAMVAAARAAVAQAASDLEQARRSLERSRQLFSQKAQSEMEHEGASTAVALAEARWSAARAQLAAQEANNVLARTNLDHAVIRSPIDGVIISRNIEPGQTVASLLQSPVLFTVAADLQRMEVETNVDEADVGEVKVGQPAAFTVNAWPGRTFAGKVVAVRNAPQVVQDVVTYVAVVRVDNDDLALRPGMTASVRIEVARVADAVQVPNAALHFTPPGQARPGRGDAVYRLDRGRIEEVPVRAGVTDGEHTAIAAEGLAPGDQVLVDLTPEGKKAYADGRAP